jgi:V8-like Glu-specific endopeptidase
LKGPCHGDSGAPVWMKDNDGDDVLVAVLRRLSKKSYWFEPICSTVYARATKITEHILMWIKETMKN